MKKEYDFKGGKRGPLIKMHPAARELIHILARIAVEDWESSLRNMTMKRERWNALMTSNKLELTKEEIKEGWHFCSDWDGLLIGPGMGELKSCLCDLPGYHEES